MEDHDEDRENNEASAKCKNKKTNVTKQPWNEGLTSPNVLVVFPLQRISLETVKTLINLILPFCKDGIEYKENIFDKFGNRKEEDSEALTEMCILKVGIDNEKTRIVEEWEWDDFI